MNRSRASVSQCGYCHNKDPFEIGKYIEFRILDGEFNSTRKLPTFQEFSRQYSVDVSIIREAITLLEIRGLVEERGPFGTFISVEHSSTQKNVIETIIGLPSESASLKSNIFQKDGPFELLEARQLVESQITGLAAQCVSKDEIKQLRKYLDADIKAFDSGKPDFGYFDRLFHITIAKASKNSLLRDLSRELWDGRLNNDLWVRLHKRIEGNQYREQWLLDHELILKALLTRDVDSASNAMWSHIENVKSTLLELSDVEQRSSA